MATPRKRYFKVADKILRKAWSNDELAGLVRLMAYLNQRWARDNVPHREAGSAAISITDLMSISGKRRADVARKSAERWRDIAEISVEHRGDVSLISWDKFSEFQEFAPRSPAGDAPDDALSAYASDHASDTASTTKKETASPPAPAGAPVCANPPAKSKAKKESKTLAPSSLREPEWQKLYAAAAEKGYGEDACLYAWGMTHAWSHRTGTARARWWVCCRDYMLTGEQWALKGFTGPGGNGKPPPKTFAQLEEDRAIAWMKRGDDDGPDQISLGDASRPVQRGDGREAGNGLQDAATVRRIARGIG